MQTPIPIASFSILPACHHRQQGRRWGKPLPAASLKLQGSRGKDGQVSEEHAATAQARVGPAAGDGAKAGVSGAGL